MQTQADSLLSQMAELSQQIRNQSHLKTDTVTGIFTEFRRTLERFQRAEEELRQQNQRLAAAREKLEVERQRYQEMFDFAPDAYLVTDASGAIIEANQAAAEMMNMSAKQLAGRLLTGFVTEKDQGLIQTLLSKNKPIQDIELRLQPAEFRALDVSVTLSTVYDENDHPVLLRWMLRDVTERKQAQAALDASERRFRTIFREAEMGIVLIDPLGKIVETNRAFQHMLGYSGDELREMELSQLAYAGDMRAFTNCAGETEEGPGEQSHFESRFQTKDGCVVWTRITLSLLPTENGFPDYKIGLVQNITVEKQTAAELVEMRRRMQESREAERLHLAQELHDGPMQDLYGAVFKINSLDDQLTDLAAREDLREAQDILRQVAGTLRTICGELRPPTLANLGLERAIRSHAEKLQEDYPELDIQLQLTCDRQELPGQVRLALYRVYQQCMINVQRHSQATQVLISFHFDDKEVVLDVWDNGKGFQMPEKWVELLRQGHYGLAGIAERVQTLGGTLRIESKPGGGTLVHVSVPRNANPGD